jgi:hypothetical protein
MPSTTVASDGARPLGEFQTIVQQNEGIFGPLLALSSQGANNIITLEIGPRPAQRAQLELIGAGSAPTKPGQDLVCVGNVLVSALPVRVAAYRAHGS